MGRGDLPHGDVVINGLRAQYCEVDVDPVSGWDPHAPHAVLEVWVFLRVTGRVNSSI